MSEEARALYADMGATPVINALGPRTLFPRLSTTQSPLTSPTPVAFRASWRWREAI